MPPSIDLHIHSSFSDGIFTPREIIKMAKAAGAIAIALTDHDTTAGIEEFLSAQETGALKLLPGVELSANHKIGSLHILGYGIDHTQAAFQKSLHEIQQYRVKRNFAIFKQLNLLGYDLSIDEINGKNSGQTGRPHIARLLVKKGIVRSEQEAFVRFLKKGATAHVAREPLSAKKAIAIIKQAGGLAVLAHPASVDPTCASIAEVTKELKESGLSGIEVFHPMHNKKHLRYYSNLCHELELFATGGSDFHGRKNEPIGLGRYGKNNLINPELWHNLENLL